MEALVLLILENGDTIRCTSLGDATEKAKLASRAEGRIFVEFIPRAGGAMTTLEYDRKSHDWISV